MKNQINLSFSEMQPIFASFEAKVLVTRVMIYTRHITNLAKTEICKFANEIH